MRPGTMPTPHLIRKAYTNETLSARWIRIQWQITSATLDSIRNPPFCAKRTHDLVPSSRRDIPGPKNESEGHIPGSFHRAETPGQGREILPITPDRELLSTFPSLHVFGRED